MKKIWVLFITFLCATFLSATPTTWNMNPQTTGYTIASGAAQLYTATFNPRNFTSCDDAAVGGQAIFINYTGIAAASMTTALVTNVKIQPQECYSVTFDDKNVSNTFTVAIMTAAATADFRFIGTRP